MTCSRELCCLFLKPSIHGCSVRVFACVYHQHEWECEIAECVRLQVGLINCRIQTHPCHTAVLFPSRGTHWMNKYKMRSGSWLRAWPHDRDQSVKLDSCSASTLYTDIFRIWYRKSFFNVKICPFADKHVECHTHWFLTDLQFPQCSWPLCPTGQFH